MVAGYDPRHARTDRLDDAGALVSEHGRAAGLGGSVDCVLVGVADPARVQPDEHLA